MACPSPDRVLDYLSARLDAQASDELDAHVDGCTICRQLIELFNVGGGCVLAGLVPGVLILGLYRAQPSWRDAARGPGLVTCFVAVAASISAADAIG